jgi:hypothetical protein
MDNVSMAPPSNLMEDFGLGPPTNVDAELHVCQTPFRSPDALGVDPCGSRQPTVTGPLSLVAVADTLHRPGPTVQIGRLEHELNKERVILGERDLELQRLRTLARQMQVLTLCCASDLCMSCRNSIVLVGGGTRARCTRASRERSGCERDNPQPPTDGVQPPCGRHDRYVGALHNTQPNALLASHNTPSSAELKQQLHGSAEAEQVQSLSVCPVVPCGPFTLEASHVTLTQFHHTRQEHGGLHDRCSDALSRRREMSSRCGASCGSKTA